MTEAEMNERDEDAAVQFAAGLTELLNEVAHNDNDDTFSVEELRRMLGKVENADTFDATSLLTRDAGVQVDLEGGVRFQVTVLQVRNNW